MYQLKLHIHMISFKTVAQEN